MAKIWQVTDVNANYMAGDDKKWVAINLFQNYPKRCKKLYSY